MSSGRDFYITSLGMSPAIARDESWVVFHNPGQGGTRCESVSAHGLTRTDCLSHFLRHIREQFDSIVVVGFSAGGSSPLEQHPLPEYACSTPVLVQCLHSAWPADVTMAVAAITTPRSCQHVAKPYATSRRTTVVQADCFARGELLPLLRHAVHEFGPRGTAYCRCFHICLLARSDSPCIRRPGKLVVARRRLLRGLVPPLHASRWVVRVGAVQELPLASDVGGLHEALLGEVLRDRHGPAPKLRGVGGRALRRLAPHAAQGALPEDLVCGRSDCYDKNLGAWPLGALRGVVGEEWWPLRAVLLVSRLCPALARVGLAGMQEVVARRVALLVSGLCPALARVGLAGLQEVRARVRRRGVTACMRSQDD
mmetsp:Transcript_52076/g.167571  ORF Transcript_52076/g.167571 Transcript_52076/m.167571 type:complete len:368 (+) Transcript_52076:324-1427(+)